MLYKYRAKKGPEEMVESTVEAASEKEAVEMINALGYIPVKLEQLTQAKESESKRLKAGKIKSRDITIFSRQMSSLLKSGVPILRAINVIQEQSENANLKGILKNMHNALKDGASLSSVLAQYPNTFSPLYIALIRTGEDSGSLPDALLRISEYRIKQEEVVSRLRMALAYPILMAMVGLGTIIFMLTFVIPRLAGIFVSMGQQLPLATRVLISLSNAMRNWVPWLILALIILLVKKQLQKAKGKVFLSRLSLKLPLFGKLIQKAEVARFSRTLELLMKSGIPILRAIDVAVPVLNNEALKEKFRESHKDLEQGGSFGKSLKNSRVLPPFMTNLIIVGEESGRLVEALSEVATSYERDTDEAIKIMTNLLEPLMILVMGLVVGFIVIAMLLPIFEINMMAR